MSEIEIITKFKKLLLSFCDELISQFPLETDFTVLRMFIENQIPTRTIIIGFHKQISKEDNKIRTMISTRNEDFFIRENPFSFISNERKDKLGILWNSDAMDKEDKEAMWAWVDSFIIISDRYHELTKK